MTDHHLQPLVMCFLLDSDIISSQMTANSHVFKKVQCVEIIHLLTVNLN